MEREFLTQRRKGAKKILKAFAFFAPFASLRENLFECGRLYSVF
jgi:hypothetical protein